jgi:hypothetical protein
LLIILFAMIIFYQTWKRREDEVSKPLEPVFPTHAAGRRIVFCLAGMTAAAAIFEFLGFVLSMFLMIVFMMRTIDPQPWKKAILYSLLSALGSLLVFKILLKTQLPSGLVGF